MYRCLGLQSKCLGATLTLGCFKSSGQTGSTDYAQLVIDTLGGMTQSSGVIDQRVLRHVISLASTYLLLDSSTNTEGGLTTWHIGFHRLVDVLTALHRRGELELQTVNEASKACSECWSIAGTWRGMDEARDSIREIAGKLKSLLDSNGRTYQGNQVYAPGR